MRTAVLCVLAAHVRVHLLVELLLGGGGLVLACAPAPGGAATPPGAAPASTPSVSIASSSPIDKIFVYRKQKLRIRIRSSPHFYVTRLRILKLK